MPKIGSAVQARIKVTSRKRQFFCLSFSIMFFPQSKIKYRVQNVFSMRVSPNPKSAIENRFITLSART